MKMKLMERLIERLKCGDIDAIECESVEDYLFYVDYMFEHHEMLVFDKLKNAEPFISPKESIGFIAKFDPNDLNMAQTNKEFTAALDIRKNPVKSVTIEMDIVKDWLKKKDMTLAEFEKRSHRLTRKLSYTNSKLS